MFNTMYDGLEVLDSLKSIIKKYGVASVADLYDISGLTSKFTDNKYGWSDISSAKVIFDNDLYILKMPKVTKLK